MNEAMKRGTQLIIDWSVPTAKEGTKVEVILGLNLLVPRLFLKHVLQLSFHLVKNREKILKFESGPEDPLCLGHRFSH